MASATPELPLLKEPSISDSDEEGKQERQQRPSPHGDLNNVQQSPLKSSLKQPASDHKDSPVFVSKGIKAKHHEDSDSDLTENSVKYVDLDQSNIQNGGSSEPKINDSSSYTER